MKKYILNSAVITSPGDYRYRLANVEEAIAWARSGFISSVGYQETAEALEQLLCVYVPVDRRTIVMQPGDEALVFRLVLPPGSRRIEPGDKGRLGEAILKYQYEMGILLRLG